MKTLVVDDELTSRMILEAALEEYGAVEVAESGIQAVEAVSRAINENEHFNLICLDISMPDMDGFTTIQHIRQLEAESGISETSPAKIVMATGRNDSENIVNAFREQCDHYFVKPVEMDKLKEFLKTENLIP